MKDASYNISRTFLFIFWKNNVLPLKRGSRGKRSRNHNFGSVGVRKLKFGIWGIFVRVSWDIFNIFSNFHCFTPKKGVQVESMKNVSVVITEHQLGPGSWNLAWRMLVAVSRGWVSFHFLKIPPFYPKIRKNVFAVIFPHQLGLGSWNLVWRIIITVSQSIFLFFWKFSLFYLEIGDFPLNMCPRL